MKHRHKLTGSTYGNMESVVINDILNTENRDISVKHWIDSNGNIEISVNGTKVSELSDMINKEHIPANWLCR